MLFNSLQFVVFLPLVVTLYYLLPYKFRVLFLLAMSYYFYMCWKAEYIILIIGSTLIDYFCAIEIGKSQTTKRKKLFLTISLLTNLGLLFSFKYFNFFNDSFRTLLSHFNIFYNVTTFKLLLPVGISFYTFQTLSYTIDVYRGHLKPEKNLSVFALYVSFFPQLVAGPIERSTNLIPQLRQNININYDNLVSGLKLILWGFFKKLVIADRLAIYVNTVYNNESHHNGSTFIIATLFFTFQVYCDFSAYSDIAIGSARMMGINLMTNFNRPFFTKSINEFWKRWHISLISWFKDYLYFPLGGNRVKKTRWIINILIVWLVSGLWHGAGWTFVMWGFLSGMFIILSIWLKPLRVKFWQYTKLNKESRIHHIIQVLFTFFLFYVVQFFFRANNINDAFSILNKVITSLGPIFTGNPTTFALSWMSIVLLLAIEFMEEYYPEQVKLFSHPSIVVRYASYATLVILILSIGVFDSSQFIYFQF